LAKAWCKYSFPFITFLYLEIIEGGNDIEFSIDFGLAKPFKSLTYKWYKVSVFNYNNIKSFVVNVESNTSSWLFVKKDRDSCWGHVRTNEPFIKIFIDILFYNQKFVFGHWVGSFVKWHFSLFGVNGMVIRLMWGEYIYALL